MPTSEHKTCIKAGNCTYCGYLCAFNATVEEGRVVGLEPDTLRYPYSESVSKGCRRWRLNLSRIDGEHRINYPLKRVGERGSGTWERVSWEEALDDIAHQLQVLVEKHGPQTLASAIGGPHGNFWPLHRFMNLLGSPNNMGIGQICWNPRIWMDVITFGWTVEPDLDFNRTEALFIWGTNPAESDNSLFWSTLGQFAQQGIPLVVIDPRCTKTARIADLWLPLKPKTDVTLALALIREIIKQGLVKQDFVDQWCHGYDELAQHVEAYTLEYAAEVCGLDAADIKKAAELFGRAKAAALISGRGIDQIGADVAPSHRAICCLRAITANVDAPGACLITEMSDFTPEIVMEMSDALAPEQKKYCLNTNFTPLQCYEGYDAIAQLSLKHGRRLPLRYMTSAHPDLVFNAMETGEPYAIRALIVEGTNPLLTYADTHRVEAALLSLDLLVVLEQDMTPTAALADYVLPIAGSLERPTMQVQGGVANCAYGGPAAVEPYYERRTDYEVFRELGIRFGQAEHWPHVTLEEAFTASFASVGMSWEQYCQTGLYAVRPVPYKHELLDDEGRPRGFATTTGKIELASEALTALGGQRLPTPSVAHAIPTLDSAAAHSVIPSESTSVISSAHSVIPSESTSVISSAPSVIPSEARNLTTQDDFSVYSENPERSEGSSDELILLTGARKQPYNASVFHDEAKFRKTYPRPLAEMSEETAARLSLEEGDEVLVETSKGSATFWVKFLPMCKDVVSIDYGWWNPNKDLAYPELGGIKEANINTLTHCSIEQGEAMVGTWSYNALTCRLYKKENQ